MLQPDQLFIVFEENTHLPNILATVFVTHDQEEALSISDRIVVMNEGAIEQVGSPAEIDTVRAPASSPRSSAR